MTIKGKIIYYEKTVIFVRHWAIAIPSMMILSWGYNNKSINRKDAQKDFNRVCKTFKTAILMINPQNTIKAVEGDFSFKMLNDLGGYIGDYQGIALTNSINNITVGESDHLMVNIAKIGANREGCQQWIYIKWATS